MINPEIYADIILPIPLPQEYTYFVPAEMESHITPGKRVIVQFGSRKLYTGIILKIHTNNPGIAGVKSIISLLDEKPIVNDIQLLFWRWMSDYYMCSIGEVYKSALPSGLKLESESHVFPNDHFNSNELAGTDLDIIYKAIQKNPGIKLRELSKIFRNKNLFVQLKQLIYLNATYLMEKLHEIRSVKTRAVLLLHPNLQTGKELDKAFSTLSAAPKQKEALKKIVSISTNSRKEILPVEIPVSDLSKLFTQGILKSLILKGFIIKEERELNPPSYSFDEIRDLQELSAAQDHALKSIKDKFLHKDVVLLHGITSSGKTEIYIHLIQDTIKEGRQVLYLLPEIAITTQIINRLRKVFGNKVGIYHSRFSDSERISVYNKMAGVNREEYDIILGVRSAIFLPFRDLGLIIVDEEHENTYKQFDPAPRYHARDSAIILASFCKAKVLLGTATPSIETYSNCLRGKYEKVILKERYGNIRLPEILISDIIDARKRKTMQSFFTPSLVKAMESTFKKGKQVILFQNRRGYSSFIECDTCGWIPRCKTCDVSLIYHKFNNSLVCHYCGYTQKVSDKCGNCENTKMITKGFGTERIEDEIGFIFPGIKVARLDLDTTRAKNSYEKILEDFGQGHIDVLVGTQMISKGLDFENVLLVGILDADQMLNYPDFRAYERSYQLMAQVSGRAGRKDERGEVIIQTKDPANSIIRFVKENDFNSMFEQQLKERQAFKYPPFVRMIKISLRHKDLIFLTKAARSLSDELRLIFGNRVLGPQAPLVGRVSNYYIIDIILKIEKQSSFQKAKGLVKKILSDADNVFGTRGLKFTVDVDPF